MKIVQQEKEKHYEILDTGELVCLNDRTSVELADCFLVVNV